MPNLKVVNVLLPLLAIGAILVFAPASASGPKIVYQRLPVANSSSVSHHGAGGPVLADDFDPAGYGPIVEAEWWGSNATSCEWELTLHFGRLGTSGFGEPAAIPTSSGGRKYFVCAEGEPWSPDGIFRFTADLPGDFFVDPGAQPLGSEYWFSVANLDDGWTWATAAELGRGIERWDPTVSTGSVCDDGGPHCGPWSQVKGENFAFGLKVLAEPSALSLLLAGMLVAFRVRRSRDGNYTQ